MKPSTLRSLFLVALILALVIGWQHGPAAGCAALALQSAALGNVGRQRGVLCTATLVGTTGTWGIASDETGLIIDTIDYDYKDKEKPVLTKAGETKGYSFYDEMVEVSLKGEATSSTPFSGKLTANLSLANAVGDHLQATESGAQNIIRSIKKSLAREDFVKFDIGSRLCPLIASS